MDTKTPRETKKSNKGEGETSQEMEKVPETVRSQPAALPEEILNIIFSHLSDPKDLMAVSNASPQFNRILKPSQSTWAFKNVFPLIYSSLDKEDILNCRAVCKEWNKSVDNFLQTLPSERPRAIYPHPEDMNGNDDTLVWNRPAHRPQYQPYLVSKGFAMILRDTQAIQKFVQEMKSHPGNPLVFRDVCFDDSLSEGEAYWIEAIIFLGKFGQHIWHVSLGPSLNRDERYHLAHNYTILQRALVLMPNLRTLILHGFNQDPLDHAADARKVDWIADYIRLNPLPRLPHLHTLTEITPDGPNPVMNELMHKYSSQLKKLVTRPYVWLKNPPQFENLPLPQVIDLDLNINACILAWRDFCGALIAPNLAKLSLIIWDNWEIGNLLQPLQEAFPSLVYLALAFRTRSRNFRSRAPPEFVLEKIKTLEVEDHSVVEYDQLLSHLPCLEYVLVCHNGGLSRESVQEVDAVEGEGDVEHVEIDDEGNMAADDENVQEEVEDDGELEIRKLMMSGAMYESDIWTRLRHLKEFTIACMGDKWDTACEIETKQQYTREIYSQKFEQRK